MAYEKETIPAENAPAPISHDFGDYVFEIDLWQATADDMALFDPEAKTNSAQMFEFLDRVVRDYRYQGESRGAGVTGKKIPYPVLVKHLMPKIGEGMKAIQTGN